jgi:hypothetical protein
MSAKVPAKRDPGKGAARGYSWPPFENGNRAALTHGVYLQKFQPGERQEIEEIAESLREAVPLYSPAFEPTLRLCAARVWRWRRAYRYLADRGKDVSHVLLRDLNTLERALQRDFDNLGVSPRSASELGINLIKLAAAGGDDEPPFDWNALERKERRELERLLAKGRANGNGA